MKKFLFLVAALLALGISTACADSDRPIDVAQLPQKAQQFIQKHFAGEKVALAKVERDFLEVRYEVIFTDGAKAEFYKDGEWKEVDCRYSSLPAGIVSMPIETKVQELYQGAAVIKIERDKQEVEVKLNNGMELTFDRSHNLIGIDD